MEIRIPGRGIQNGTNCGYIFAEMLREDMLKTTSRTGLFSCTSGGDLGGGLPLED
jgi:hypothetical protein